MTLHSRWWNFARSVFLAIAVLAAVYGSIPSTQAADTEAPVVHVDQLDPEADMRPFDKPGYKIRDRSKNNDEIPAPKTRDAAFRSAGLLKDVKDWDAVERDVLYLRAKTMSLQDLKARYPKLDSEALGKLRDSASKR